MRSSTIALVVSAIFAFAVSASPVYAEDIQHFGPAVDVDKRNKPGSYQTEERRSNPKPKPSPTYNPHPYPSGKSPDTTSGTIQIHDDGGLKRAFLGYVSKHPTAYGAYQLTQNFDDALRVKVDVYLGSIPPNNLIALNGDLVSKYPYVSGIVSAVSKSNDIGPGNSDYLFMGPSDWSYANSKAVYLGNALDDYLEIANISVPCESAIWTFNEQSRRLTPQWVNTQFDKPATYAAVAGGVLVFTGDMDATFSTWNIGQPVVGPVSFTLL